MAQMVLKMVVTVPWNGIDWEAANDARKIMAQAVAEIGRTMMVEPEYEEAVTSVRAKRGGP